MIKIEDIRVKGKQTYECKKIKTIFTVILDDGSWFAVFDNK